jgi:hypothetical protein
MCRKTRIADKKKRKDLCCLLMEFIINPKKGEEGRGVPERREREDEWEWEDVRSRGGKGRGEGGREGRGRGRGVCQ